LVKLFHDNNTVGIYIHFPFCVSKCIYCDFYSVPINKFEPIRSKYTKYLIREFSLFRRYISNFFKTITLYIGGGSPNLLTLSELEQIFHFLYNEFGLNVNSEISIELNPVDIDSELLRKYREFGINRLSFGFQSFNDELLKFLKRRNRSRDNIIALNKARDLGFGNINVDLIFGISGQSLEDFKRDIKEILIIKPEHISLYNLIYEENTELMRMSKTGIIKHVNEEIEFKMYEYAHNILTENGYEHYEISNFSKPGYQCLHNLNYWNRGYYIGFGPSAHSFFKNRRWSNLTDIRKYMKMIDKNRLPIENEYCIGEKDKIKEMVMLKLRLKDGLKLSSLKEIVKNREDIIDKIIHDVSSKYRKYIILDGENFKINVKGWFILNSIIADIFYIIDEFYEEIGISELS